MIGGRSSCVNEQRTEHHCCSSSFRSLLHLQAHLGCDDNLPPLPPLVGPRFCAYNTLTFDSVDIVFVVDGRRRDVDDLPNNTRRGSQARAAYLPGFAATPPALGYYTRLLRMARCAGHGGRHGAWTHLPAGRPLPILYHHSTPSRRWCAHLLRYSSQPPPLWLDVAVPRAATHAMADGVGVSLMSILMRFTTARCAASRPCDFSVAAA